MSSRAAIRLKKGIKPLKIGSPKNIPEKEVDFDQVLFWIEHQADLDEISSSFRMKPEKLNLLLVEQYGMNFEELKDRLAGSAKLAIRRQQFLMMKTSPQVLIWMSGIYLKQQLSNKQEQKVMHTLEAILQKIDKDANSKELVATVIEKNRVDESDSDEEETPTDLLPVNYEVEQG